MGIAFLANQVIAPVFLPVKYNILGRKVILHTYLSLYKLTFPSYK